MIKTLLPVAIITALQIACGHSPASDTSTKDDLEQFVAAFNRYGMFDGAVLVMQGDDVLLSHGYGLASREQSIPNAPDTKFRIGSITKAFTATLALQLVDSGRIELDEPVSRYLPEYHRTTFDRITVRHLLTHTSGLPDYNDDPAHFNEVQSGQLNNEQRITRISRLRLRFEPGKQYGYSNDGYHLLGAVIERVAGGRYEQVLSDRILRPLGLANSGYMSETAFIPGLATGYRKSGGVVERARYYRESPASGMYATVADLQQFYRAISRGELLSTQSRALVLDGSRANNAYGFHARTGFDSIVPDTTLVIEGDGAVFGFFARVLWIPSDEVFVAVMTNVRAPRNRLPDIARGLASYLYQHTPAAPRPSLADSLRAGIAMGGARWLEQIQDSSRFDTDEAELNVLGYELLAAGQKVEAVRVFELNRRLFPSSANVFDSLADGYLAVADTAAALSAYLALERFVASKPDPAVFETRLLANARERITQLTAGANRRSRE